MPSAESRRHIARPLHTSPAGVPPNFVSFIGRPAIAAFPSDGGAIIVPLRRCGALIFPLTAGGRQLHEISRDENFI